MNYQNFDQIITEETNFDLCASDILNNPSFYAGIQLIALRDGIASANTYTTVINNQHGVYHIWIDTEEVSDSYLHKMKCIYVGKGEGGKRVKDHLSSKLIDYETVYVSFFECNNRKSKYIEQLFLDLYDIELNKAECRGTESLYANFDFNHRIIGSHPEEFFNRFFNIKGILKN